MPFHLSAYRGTGTTSVLTDIAAIGDDILTIQNGHFILPRDLKLWWAAAMGVTIKRARLNSPYLRQYNPSYIRPITAGATPGNNPNVGLYLRQPMILKGQEELAFEAFQDSGGNETETAIIAVGDTLDPVPAGEIITCRLTGTATHTAGAWTTVAYTMETALPQGRYAMIYSDCITATLIAHRWIFDNQSWRPGGLGLLTNVTRSNYLLDQWSLGVYGYFVTYSLPRLQVLSTAADTAQETYIDVVRVGAS